MIEIIIGLLACVLIFGAIIVLAVRRGLQIKELCEHGVEVVGTVASKRSVKSSNAGARDKKLVYRYTDSTGAGHSHTSVVPIDVYNRYAEGDAIEIVYSSRNPATSAPKYLVDQARGALNKH